MSMAVFQLTLICKKKKKKKKDQQPGFSPWAIVYQFLFTLPQSEHPVDNQGTAPPQCQAAGAESPRKKITSLFLLLSVPSLPLIPPTLSPQKILMSHIFFRDTKAPKLLMNPTVLLSTDTSV